VGWSALQCLAKLEHGGRKSGLLRLNQRWLVQEYWQAFRLPVWGYLAAKIVRRVADRVQINLAILRL
jgi:hypothetical protein